MSQQSWKKIQTNHNGILKVNQKKEGKINTKVKIRKNRKQKMLHLSPSISIISLNVYSLNMQIKRHNGRIVSKYDTIICL